MDRIRSSSIDILKAARSIAKSQKRVSDLVTHMLEGEKLPSSMLFAGPEGSGKELMALYFAARINCSGDCFKEELSCPVCSKISRLEHPDVHLVYPLPYGSIEKSYPVVIESRREDFFNSGEFGRKARSIGIDLIRDVIEKASKHPFEGKKTLVIIYEAHLATIEAQNAFLKLLEEPPKSVVIILVTEFPDKLLPTITSRCYEVRFDYLSAADVESFLIENRGLKKEEAIKRAVLAEGNIRRAVRYGDKRFRGLVRKAERIVGLILDGEGRNITLETEALAVEYDREELAALLEEIARVFRILMKSDQKRGELQEAVLAELGRERIAGAKKRNIPADLEKIFKASENLSRNADVELTLLQLMLDLAGEWY
ncbi:MAG: AAA family ATPase [Candidatus Krumholzibacteriota bacterium]|nr:AAA family ATPase [Candidatus Krumholzibacteriota bacterium]